MRKKMKRWLTVLLAMVLVVTSVDMTSLVAKAATGDTTVTLADLEDAGLAAQVTDGETISYTGQYQSNFYKIPANVDMSKVEMITFNFSQNADKVSIKTFTEAEYTSNKWGSGMSGNTMEGNVLLPEDTTKADLKYFAIMSNVAPAEGETLDVKLTSIVFSERETVTYNVNQLNFTDRWSSTEFPNGALTFSAQYNERWAALPSAISLADCEKVTFTFAEKNTANMAFKLYNGTTAVVEKYNNKNSLSYSHLLSGTDFIDKIAVTHNDAAVTDVSVNFASVKFTFKPGASVPSLAVDRYYTFTGMSPTYNDGGTVDVSGSGKLDVSFAGQYNEIRYAVPEGVTFSTIEKFVLDVTEGTVNDMAVKLYIDGAQKQAEYHTSELTVSAENAELLKTATSVHIGIMQNASTAGKYAIESILLTAEQTGGSETKPVHVDDPTVVDRYYTFTGMSPTYNDGGTVDVSGSGKLDVSFAGQYNEIRYAVPEGVTLSTIEKFVLDVTEGTVNDMAVKLYIDGAQKQAEYHTSELTVSAENAELLKTATSVHIGIMQNASTAGEYAIESILLTAVQTGGMDEKPTHDSEQPSAVTSKYYSFNDVTNAGGYGYVAKITEGGALFVDLGKNYQEVMYSLPEGVDSTTLEKIVLDVTSDHVENLAVRLYVDGKDAQTAWGTNTLNVTADVSTGEVLFAIVNKNETVDLEDVVVRNIQITAAQTGGSDTKPDNADEEPEETYEVTYLASDLILDGKTATSAELTEEGWSVAFGALNEEVRFNLPEVYNMGKCASITFTMASQTGPVNFSLAADGTKLENIWYKAGADSYTITPTITDKINQIVIQCAGETYTEGSAFVLESVTFEMKGNPPLATPTDGVYNMNYFEEGTTTSTGTTVTPDEEAGTAEVDFAAEGDTLTLAIPDSVDLNHLTDITVNGASVSDVKIEVLDKDGDVIATADGNVAETKCNPEAASIKITSLKDNVSISLSNVTFNVDPEAFEAIVLNGDFARDDISMWKGALWGSVDGVDTTITTAVSDTPIYGDVYTYGVLSTRSSDPKSGSQYVCFKQDITDRIEPGYIYDYEFYVKLSEDYRDAPGHLSMVSFNPYYVDAAGKEQYGMRVGAGSTVKANPDGWIKVSSNFGIPENAKEVYIRIMEQGTDYGNGECLRGGYYITGVKVKATGQKFNPNSGSSGGSSSTNTTVTKEATWIGTYDMDDLLVEWASATYTKNSDDSLIIGFKNNYDEVRMDLPRELDMSTVAYIKTAIESQNVPIAVKLYNNGSQVDVAYYNNIQSLYTWVPSYTGEIDAIGIMSLAIPNPEGAFAKFSNITFGLTAEPAPIPPRTSIVLNGDFSDSDLSDWKASFWGDGVTMTQKRSSTPIAAGIYNYASYSKRTSPYQCFAQDITEAVEEGETYTFSFWARLSDAYKGAPPAQRTIQFGPYTTDSSGVSDYNPKLEGTYAQVCEPGVWTYFEGTYKVTNPNDVKKVVIRILEQGTNYGQGDCVLGGYDIANVKMEKYIPEPPSIDEDVPNLKDALTEVFGDDFIVSAALTTANIDDIGYEMLINKHFNAITIGNELKPDALFNYSNDQHTDLQTITFNGQSLEVPTLYFYRAEEVLDKILEWNATHPETPIKVRGHVLVWHAQTPEWFFREGYVVGKNADGSENYVTPEVMNLRLEWYTKTVLEHFTGEDSPYKDLFYGWDVVNEAVRDGSTDYRTDKVSTKETPSDATHGSNSSWWAVYQSNEFIINAFKYANMYAPADLELYYNDYNECDSKKVEGIVKLLTAVKEAEGTRIDGMGMQGHYGMMNPALSAFEEAVRAYAGVVGKVMITEWDLKASGDISTDSSLKAEYLAQADRYRDFYEVALKLHKEGIDIGGFVFWGLIDPHSWLQTQSNVGGGADGTMSHCPLLFDGNYKVKPAYWAFVDYDVINPDYESPVKDAEEDDSDADKEEVVTPDDTETDDTKAEETKDTDTKEDDAKPADSKNTTEDEGSGVLPFAVGGGVAGVGILAGIIAWLKKRGKKA